MLTKGKYVYQFFIFISYHTQGKVSTLRGEYVFRYIRCVHFVRESGMLTTLFPFKVGDIV